MAVVNAIHRFEIWLVKQGSEINKTQPCVVISSDELNQFLRTVTIAALTSAHQAYPSRVDCKFQGKTGQVTLDHIRLVDETQLVRKLGTIPTATAREICVRLAEMFQY